VSAAAFNNLVSCRPVINWLSRRLTSTHRRPPNRTGPRALGLSAAQRRRSATLTAAQSGRVSQHNGLREHGGSLWLRAATCYRARVPTWVCLLRGVNLGRQRKLPMAALRDSLTAAGMTSVRTYLQSGNIVVESPLRTHAQVSSRVRAVVAEDFSMDVPVITRRPAEIDRLIAGNPFAAYVAQRPHLIRVIFLDAVPSPERVDLLAAVEAIRDTCRVIGSHVYVDYVRGYHTTHRTAPYFTGILGVDGTERNWRTVLALADLLRQTPTPAVKRKT
jgi:uncharacterized protein (DUF1697 family)